MKNSTKALIRSIYVRLTDIIRRTPFARSRRGRLIAFEHAITLSQPFKPSATLEAKKHNLREAASRINDIVIAPGEVFSFWHIVGNPNNKRRFREGRSIHKGRVSTDVGGGLCQASGIIHHLALLAGLQVIERYNHSVDLYTDETRFAPLGTDATVFYGFRDLRILNNTTSAIRFQLYVEENELQAELSSERPLAQDELDIRTEVDERGYKHVVVRNSTGMVISTSVYEPLAD